MVDDDDNDDVVVRRKGLVRQRQLFARGRQGFGAGRCVREDGRGDVELDN